MYVACFNSIFEFGSICILKKQTVPLDRFCILGRLVIVFRTITSDQRPKPEFTCEK